MTKMLYQQWAKMIMLLEHLWLILAHTGGFPVIAVQEFLMQSCH